MTRTPLTEQAPIIQSAAHQYDGIQALRFLAALMVVLCHAFYYTAERLGAEKLAFNNGGRGVDIFFAISGFVMVIASRDLVGKANGWREFALQRLTRIVPMYWLSLSLKVLVMLLSSGLVLHATFHPWNALLSYFFIPCRTAPGVVETILGVGWTLVFEMFFYLVFTLGLLIRANIYLFTGSIMVTLAALSLARPSDFPAYMYLLDPIVLEFFMGMLVGRMALAEKPLPRRVAWILIPLSLIFLLAFPNQLLPRLLESGLPAAILVYAVISVEAELKYRIPKFVLFFGSASYSLYLFHPLILPAVPLLLKKASVPVFWVSILLCTLLSLITAALMYLQVESRITRWFKTSRLIKRQARKTATGFAA